MPKIQERNKKWYLGDFDPSTKVFSPTLECLDFKEATKQLALTLKEKELQK